MEISHQPVSFPLPSNDRSLKIDRPNQSFPIQEEQVTSDSPELREWFDKAIGETFFRQLVSEMRKGVEKPAYFHGGRAEEVFQGELDNLIIEKMSESSAEKFTGPMFELFQLQLDKAKEAGRVDDYTPQLMPLPRR